MRRGDTIFVSLPLVQFDIASLTILLMVRFMVLPQPTLEGSLYIVRLSQKWLP